MANVDRDPPSIERLVILQRPDLFWLNVAPGKSDQECWEWEGFRNRQGYGYYTYTDGGLFKRNGLAHRLAWEMERGPVAPGLTLDHLCRNRACVNPDHLEPVTHRTNILRGAGIAAKNAAKTRCIHGHELAGSNLIVRKDGTGRKCRQCKRESALQAWRRKQAATR